MLRVTLLTFTWVHAQIPVGLFLFHPHLLRLLINQSLVLRDNKVTPVPNHDHYHLAEGYSPSLTVTESVEIEALKDPAPSPALASEPSAAVLASAIRVLTEDEIEERLQAIAEED